MGSGVAIGVAACRRVSHSRPPGPRPQAASSRRRGGSSPRPPVALPLDTGLDGARAAVRDSGRAPRSCSWAAAQARRIACRRSPNQRGFHRGTIVSGDEGTKARSLATAWRQAFTRRSRYLSRRWAARRRVRFPPPPTWTGARERIESFSTLLDRHGVLVSRAFFSGPDSSGYAGFSIRVAPARIERQTGCASSPSDHRDHERVCVANPRPAALSGSAR